MLVRSDANLPFFIIAAGSNPVIIFLNILINIGAVVRSAGCARFDQLDAAPLGIVMLKLQLSPPPDKGEPIFCLFSVTVNLALLI